MCERVVRVPCVRVWGECGVRGEGRAGGREGRKAYSAIVRWTRMDPSFVARAMRSCSHVVAGVRRADGRAACTSKEGLQ